MRPPCRIIALAPALLLASLSAPPVSFAADHDTATPLVALTDTATAGASEATTAVTDTVAKTSAGTTAETTAAVTDTAAKTTSSAGAGVEAATETTSAATETVTDTAAKTTSSAGAAVEAASKTTSATTATVADTVAKTTAAATATVDTVAKTTATVAKTASAVTTPAARTVRAAAPTGPAAVPSGSARPTATGASDAADPQPGGATQVSSSDRPDGRTDAPRSSGSTAPTAAAAATQGGVDKRSADADRGLGSSQVGPRDGGVEDGSKVATAAEPVAVPETVRPPATAPPGIVAAAGHSSPRHVRRGTQTAASESSAARFRQDPHRAGLPLAPPGAERNPVATTRRSPVIATRGSGGARTPVPEATTPDPATPAAASTGTSAAGASVPPPAAVSALALAALGLLAVVSTILLTHPALPRPVPFISLLERPG